MEGPLNVDDSRQVVAFLCRTSDRSTDGMAGAAALGERFGARAVGSVGEARSTTYQQDLTDSRGCLLEAGGQLDDAFEAGKVPILLAGTCSISVTTLPIVMRHHPEAFVLWLDAHADFNTPDTSSSQFLGGMCLAGACGLWDTGFGAGVDPARVVMFGVRDVEGPERVLLERQGVGTVDRPGALADLLDARKVFIHLDLDILDPSVLPSDFPAPGGLDHEQLRRLLDLVCGAAEVVGVEVTGAHPDHTDALAETLAPLL
ncbi:N(omega)-hydroxy-L-arginine amidinohydrolase [Paraconexibacter sp. AEG42_29]|uniref:N(Omega)-hydroxy-L-arginine amidinohydrolase n=1 Tax=Paraconexibacter sp. AEG42_29 TaxID=2997339 RepID=A0AAU7ASI1_9ACTN